MSQIIHADCLEALRAIEDNTVDAVVTDPPYGLAFMGKKWDYDVPSVEIWAECLRVLKPGGYLLSFAGTRTQHRMAVRIEDAGFEIRDMIAWVYGSGFPKSLNIGKAIDKLQGNEREKILVPSKAGNSVRRGEGEQGSTYGDGHGGFTDIGRGTALKPALEPITVARKPLSEKSVAENCLKWGTGGINIDECRVESTEFSKDLGTKRPQSDDYVFKSFDENTRPSGSGASSPLGRFPANLIHDGSDEVVSLFPNTKSGGADGNRRGHGPSFGDVCYGEYKGLKTEGGLPPSSGSASRFFYCAKASKSERNKGCEELEDSLGGSLEGGNDKRNGDKPQLKPTKNSHPTVKPIALMEYLVKLVSREGAVVLDPFLGSGTTGVACKNLNRNFIGIEMDENYFEIAKKRIL